MWEVYRLEEGHRVWYGEIPGEWLSVADRACRWSDKKAAQFVAIYVRGHVGECNSTRKVIQIAATTDTNNSLDVCYALKYRELVQKESK